MIEFNCPHCARKFSVNDSKAGLSGPCPSCQREVRVPSLAPPPFDPRELDELDGLSERLGKVEPLRAEKRERTGRKGRGFAGSPVWKLAAGVVVVGLVAMLFVPGFWREVRQVVAGEGERAFWAWVAENEGEPNQIEIVAVEGPRFPVRGTGMDQDDVIADLPCWKIRYRAPRLGSRIVCEVYLSRGADGTMHQQDSRFTGASWSSYSEVPMSRETIIQKQIEAEEARAREEEEYQAQLAEMYRKKRERHQAQNEENN